MRAAAVMLVAIACDPLPARAPHEQRMSIDATSLRALLKCARDTPPCDHHVRDIRIEPLGRNAARYILHRTDTATSDEADAEFPGHIVDEIHASKIPVTIVPPVEDPWPITAREMQEIDLDTLRHDLTIDQALEIEAIHIEPLDHDAARYVITWKTSNRRNVVTAPFPGTLTDEIYAANVPYGVRAPLE